MAERNGARLSMNEHAYWKELNERLKEQGSWLYGEEKPRVDLSAFFNTASTTIPMGQRVLIVKELIFCGVDLASRKRSLNSLTSPDEQVLQTILEASSDPEFSSLDIHYPLNWFRGEDAGFFYGQNTGDAREGGPSYRMVIEGLEVMTPQLFERLITKSDPLMRKRLVYLEHSFTRPNIRIFPNDEPMMNAVEERLLEQIDSYPPATRAGYGVVELLAEDIHDGLDEEHRHKRMEYANRLFTAVEEMDTVALNDMRSSFRNGRIAPEGQQEAPIKEWLYEQVWDIALQRELAKLRGVELVLKSVVRIEGK